MSIITISRELAALGDETAHELAGMLHYRLVDRHALEERIKSYGVTGEKLEKYDERKPSFLASLSQDRDDYLHYLKTALFSEAGEGNGVIVGRGASMILKNVPGVFSIFLAAPLDIRIERVKSYFHCDEKRARQILNQSDSDREGFHRYFFDIRWKDAGNYHLTLNTGHIAPKACADIIAYMHGQVNTPELEEENRVKLQELILGQKIKQAILYGRQIPVHFLETVIRWNQVILYGVATSQSQVEAALAVARENSQDMPVVSEIQVIQEYHMMGL